MIYKNIDLKKYKYQGKKLIFSIILIIYIAGICTGSLFAFKNSHNLAFIQKVTFAENITKVENTAFLARSVKFFIRDIMLICLILIFKYSGILKGMCITVPFVFGVQNSCIYSTIFSLNQLSAFNILFNYIIRDTAVILIVLVYLLAVITEIIVSKENVKKDIKNLIIFIFAVLCIYIIDLTIKSFIYNF